MYDSILTLHFISTNSRKSYRISWELNIKGKKINKKEVVRYINDYEENMQMLTIDYI